MSFNSIVYRDRDIQAPTYTSNIPLAHPYNVPISHEQYQPHPSPQGVELGDYDQEKVNVANDIEQIVFTYNQILELSTVFGTNRDTEKNRQAIRGKMDEANRLVETIQISLDKLKSSNTRGSFEERHEKKQHIDKLESTFSRFLVKLHQHTRMVDEKMIAPVYSANQFSAPGYFLSEQEDSDQDEHTQLLTQVKHQEYINLATEANDQSSRVLERDEAIQKLQREMIEVHYVFRDLANLVSEQGCYIPDIESHIESAKQDVVIAKSEIQSAHKLLTSGKKVLFCISLLIIVVVVIVVIATTKIFH